jgi:hypothetical protein
MEWPAGYRKKGRDRDTRTPSLLVMEQYHHLILHIDGAYLNISGIWHNRSVILVNLKKVK